MQILRQSTAIDVRVGPAMDATDGVSPEVGITIAAADQADILKADGAATVTMAGVLAAVTNVDGWYDYTMSTGDTDTVGTLDLVLQDASVMLPIFARFQVLAPAAFDALYAAVPTILVDKDIGLFYKSDIATVNSQTSFDGTIAIITDDNWNGLIATIEDISTGDIVSRAIVDVVQANDRIVIDTAPPFTVVVGDIIRVHYPLETAAALDTYDGTKRTESTADRDTITSKMLNYFRVVSRNDTEMIADNATEITEINSDQGSGTGTYDPATDALEAAAFSRSNLSTSSAVSDLSSRLPAALSASGNMQSNILEVNTITLQGIGSEVDPWRPV